MSMIYIFSWRGKDMTFFCELFGWFKTSQKYNTVAVKSVLEIIYYIFVEGNKRQSQLQILLQINFGSIEGKTSTT